MQKSALGNQHLAFSLSVQGEHRGVITVTDKAMARGHIAGMKDFRDLLVWRKAHTLTLAIYLATAKFPGDERFGLTVQMRRSSVLISARLAEGCGKRGNGEFYRFLNIATASASELEYCILLARDLKFLDEETYTSLDEKIVEVRKMLGALISKVGEDSRLTA